MRLEFVEFNVFLSEPVQQSNRSKNISVRLHRDTVLTEAFGEELLRRHRGEAPVFAPLVHVDATDLADAGKGCQQHTAGFEQSMHRRYRGVQIVDELKRLRDDQAVKRV